MAHKPDEFTDRLAPAPYVQLAVDLVRVRLNRATTHDESRRDLGDV